MRDYYPGGKDNYAADRMVARRFTGACPQVREAAQANRAFHQRAVAWMARSGIRQFLDAGCGLPANDNTHEIARREHPGARVLYADRDPMVLTYARGLLAGPPGVQALQGDVRDPEAILSSREAAEVLRPGEPAGLMLTAVLHFVTNEEDPAGLARRFMAGLAPGSCVAISHGTLDKLPRDAGQVSLKIYGMVAEPVVMRTHAQVGALFAGLELLPPWKGSPPAVVTLDSWLGPGIPLSGGAAAMARKGGEALWCGVARKPS